MFCPMGNINLSGAKAEIFPEHKVNTIAADALATDITGHQQPWYWLCRINKSLSSAGDNFNNLYYLNVKKG